MERTDYSKLTTDDLLEIIPATETSDWEYKAADVFQKANFGNFKSEKLPKLVSSFANSGGGQLLLGKRDGVPEFDDVRATEGRASMEDHLSLVISQCVTPHYKEFEIFRVPISGKHGESVLVVAFHDSQAAPHQSNAGPNYFWRLPGSVQPAPHFHLELLRNRMTRAALKIQGIEHKLEAVKPIRESGGLVVDVCFIVDVENVSMQSATAWGIRIQSHRLAWRSRDVQRELHEGACVIGTPTPLLPSARTRLALQIEGNVGSLREWPLFDATFAPVSQDCVGEPVRYYFESSAEKFGQEHAQKEELIRGGFM